MSAVAAASAWLFQLKISHLFTQTQTNVVSGWQSVIIIIQQHQRPHHLTNICERSFAVCVCVMQHAPDYVMYQLVPGRWFCMHINNFSRPFHGNPVIRSFGLYSSSLPTNDFNTRIWNYYYIIINTMALWYLLLL